MNKDEEEFKDTKASFTENENKLCDKVGLKPHEYLLIKEILVRESVSQGFLSKEYVNQVFDSKRTEKHKIMEVFDFLVTHDLVLER
jgi:transcriptional adapter 2-alpha